jgi:hypothetical protein
VQQLDRRPRERLPDHGKARIENAAERAVTIIANSGVELQMIVERDFVLVSA